MPSQGLEWPFSSKWLRSHSDQAVEARLENLTQSTFVSFAVEGNSISIWVADNRGMRFHAANGSFGDVMDALRELRGLCEHPWSSQHRLMQRARQLYQLLLEPVKGLLDPRREIQFHMGGNFPHVPMGLLADRDGTPVGDVYTHRYVTGFPWEWPSSPGDCFGVGSRLLFAAADDGHCPDYLMQAAMRFPQNDMVCGPGATWQQVSRLAPAAELLHLQGKARMGERGPLLLLGEGADAARQREDLGLQTIDPAGIAPDW
ncbi:MAG: hypothetical protein MUF01_18695, partial [Bryobacterales bacterium]|nr:hypothetical protein [Bryobacterales bacterium]